MTAQTLTLTDFLARIAGRQPCCGATNEPCALPPGVVLRLLAQPFASHPDFREEWRA